MEIKKQINGIIMPISEVADRYSIIVLKIAHGMDQPTDFKQYIDLLNHYPKIYRFVRKLEDINSKIWDLESDIRKGKEGFLGINEVGKRALKIRDYNNKRIAIKNAIALEYGGHLEVKIDHASE